MLTSIRRDWAIVPASKAGPAFIVGGVLSVISVILGFLIPPITSTSNELSAYDWAGSLISISLWALGIIITLALLAGVAATYTRWRIALNSLGKLGLLLAAIGFAVPTITGVVFIISDIIDFISNMTRNYGFLGILHEYYVVTPLVLANRLVSYTLWVGIVLVGIYVMRTNVNLLPNWAKRLPLFIGLWGLLAHFVSSNMLPMIFPSTISEMGLTLNPWREGLGYVLSFLNGIFWVLLGVAFRSKQLGLSAQMEPAVELQSKIVSHNSGLPS